MSVNAMRNVTFAAHELRVEIEKLPVQSGGQQRTHCSFAGTARANEMKECWHQKEEQGSN